MKCRNTTSRILEVEYDINLRRTGSVSVEIEEGDNEAEAIRQAIWNDVQERIDREDEPDDGDSYDYDITDEVEIHESDEERENGTL